MRSLMRFWVLLFLLPVIALWTAGLWITPRPEVLAILFLTSLLGGFGLLGATVKFWKRQKAGSALLLSGLAGLFSFAGACIFIVALFYPWSHLAATITAGDTGIAAPGNDAARTLRVVNFNIFHGYPDFSAHEKRAAVLVKMLERQRADIIILQDAWYSARHGHFAEELGRKFGMNVAYARAAGSRMLVGFEDGLAVLSRYPIIDARRISTMPQKPFWLPRPALVAIIEIGGGQRVSIVDVHLGADGFGASEAQVATLQMRLADFLDRNSPVIAAGDFHEGKFSPAAENFARAFSMRDYMPGERDEDHIFIRTGDDWSVVAARFVSSSPEELDLSDHLAIRVDLVRKPS